MMCKKCAVVQDLSSLSSLSITKISLALGHSWNRLPDTLHKAKHTGAFQQQQMSVPDLPSLTPHSFPPSLVPSSPLPLLFSKRMALCMELEHTMPVDTGRTVRWLTPCAVALFDLISLQQERVQSTSSPSPTVAAPPSPLKDWRSTSCTLGPLRWHQVRAKWWHGSLIEILNLLACFVALWFVHRVARPRVPYDFYGCQTCHALWCLSSQACHALQCLE